MSGGEASHSDLIALAATWLRKRKGCAIVITDMTSGSPETPDAIGFKGRFSYLVECKTSRADFLADRKKFFRRPGHGCSMGSFRYMLAPVGMIRSAELPDGWGLLEPGRAGAVEVYPVPPYARESDRSYEIDLLCSALRRMVGPGVRGVMCRTYMIEGNGEPRATVAAQPITLEKATE